MFRPIDVETRMFALGNLPFHALHQHDQLLRLMVSFGLLAHSLEILRSVGNTIRHWGMILVWIRTTSLPHPPAACQSPKNWMRDPTELARKSRKIRILSAPSRERTESTGRPRKWLQRARGETQNSVGDGTANPSSTTPASPVRT